MNKMNKETHIQEGAHLRLTRQNYKSNLFDVNRLVSREKKWPDTHESKAIHIAQ